MGTTADAVIAAMHAGDEQLAPLVRALTPEQLIGPSAATDWTVAQVLSHLGSGAVIALAGLDASIARQPNPGMEANKLVWARWDTMSPQEQLDEYVVANAALLARYDSIDAATRESLHVDLGFLPEPIDLASAATFRLNEFALHSWDVRVSLDPDAVVHPLAVPLLLGQTEFMLGWIAKPAAAMAGREVTVLVSLHDPDRSFGLVLGESATITQVPQNPGATLSASAEAWLRLATGRLAPAYTPAGTELTGDLTLDTLRAVFPGF